MNSNHERGNDINYLNYYTGTDVHIDVNLDIDKQLKSNKNSFGKK